MILPLLFKASIDCNGQVNITGTPPPNNCALRDYHATFFTPKSIADQLAQKGKSWKSYQESLPTVVPGVFGVIYSGGANKHLSRGFTGFCRPRPARIEASCKDR
jgi:hypothetical protein